MGVPDRSITRKFLLGIALNDGPAGRGEWRAVSPISHRPLFSPLPTTRPGRNAMLAWIG
jgi:hypothetical protein